MATKSQCRTRPSHPLGSLSAAGHSLWLLNRLVPIPVIRLAAYLQRGIHYGFRIGLSPSQELQCCKTNLPSIRLNRQVVDDYIHDEVASEKLKPVATVQELPQIHLSPIGMIPKPNQPGKFRLICDLPSPPNRSVNDRIAPELCSLQYASVDQAVALASHLGRGSLMAKLDLKSAYCMIPIHLEDQQLLGLEWGGTTYCRSGCSVWSQVSSIDLHCSGRWTGMGILMQWDSKHHPLLG